MVDEMPFLGQPLVHKRGHAGIIFNQKNMHVPLLASAGCGWKHRRRTWPQSNNPTIRAKDRDCAEGDL
jgi:hypothetical protein